MSSTDVDIISSVDELGDSVDIAVDDACRDGISDEDYINIADEEIGNDGSTGVIENFDFNDDVLYDVCGVVRYEDACVSGGADYDKRE